MVLLFVVVQLALEVVVWWKSARGDYMRGVYMNHVKPVPWKEVLTAALLNG